MVVRFCFFCLVLFSAQSIVASEFATTVDQTHINADEHMVLTFTLTNSDTPLRAEGLSPTIELNTLSKDFDLGRPTTSKRYNLVNGQGRSTETLTVALFPKRIGTLRIPPFTLDGLKTKPIFVTITQPADHNAPEVFSRAGATKASVWQREQLVVYLDLYHRTPLKSAQLGDELSAAPTPIDLLDFSRLITQERTETHAGFTYTVTRNSWVLYPKETGVLTLTLPDVWVVTQAQRQLRLAAQIQTIQVKALPANVPLTLPVGKVTLHQTDAIPILDNTFIGWTVTISGPVALTEFPEQLSIHSQEKIFIDRAIKTTYSANDDIINSARYSITAPTPATGAFTLPAMSWPYFDTESGITTSALLPAHSITIARQATPYSEHPNPKPEKLLPTVTKMSPSNYAWQIISGIFAFAAALTFLALKKKRSSPQINTSTSATETFPPTPQNTFKLELLNALHARSLDQGLAMWERQYGTHPQVKSAVTTVQRLCYSEDHQTDWNALRENVTVAIGIIRSSFEIEASIDPWAPTSFVTFNNAPKVPRKTG